jgi:hypothetical protein
MVYFKWTQYELSTLEIMAVSLLLGCFEVGGYTPGGVEAIAKPVDEVWAGHLARFEVAVNAHGG